jgi:hypothetical protein
MATEITLYDTMGGRNTDPRIWNMANAPFEILDNGTGEAMTIQSAFSPIQAALSVDVAIASPGTWVSLLEETGLAAGTYMVLGQAHIDNAATGTANASVLLWNGAATGAAYYSQGAASLGNSEFKMLTILAIVTITAANVTAGTNNIELSLDGSTTSVTAKAASLYESEGNYATQLVIQRLA